MIPLSRKEVQVAHIKDIKPALTNGGTSTAATWMTRDLNTLELSDPNINWVSLGVNQFTLQPGVYEFESAAPAMNCGQHQTRLFNVTNSVAQFYGSSAYSSPTYPDTFSDSMMMGTLILTVATTFSIQHQVNTGFAAAGLGIDTGGTFSPSNVNLFTRVKVKRIGD